ncbi:proton-conducting transporter transmembrane domain-containing protein [Thermococcus barophilus]|uniref:Membrane bound subgroup 4b [NiFe]-hydrogenase MBH(B)1, subunit Mbh(B)1H n=1 Tax=Thermococcus barophilus TaxID=55802 RepID=A0A0S1XA36_THEBA|nr:proton-conducting transporter membrane subunit [Thermococcus barophilus]ALM74616.1 Membrane bound subgroup 4b [NiFe]-hydrogenase MBH(b)1, subunit Mbh(b)1H' [Thermococcus barophilus]
MIFVIIFTIAFIVGLVFRRATKAVSFLSALGSLALMAEALRGFWVSYEVLGISLTFGVDNLSRFFGILIGVAGFAVSIYSISYMKPRHLVPSAYPAFLLSMALVVFSRDFIGFFVFWELMTLASYVLIVAEYEKATTRKAGLLYFVTMHLLNTMPLILAFGYIYHVAGTLSFEELQNLVIPSWTAGLIFIGFASKAGIFPIHFWLPEAHPIAPSNASALLSGVMLKMAVYGLLRSVELFSGWESLAVLVVVLSTLTILIGSLLALGQDNIKRMMAYSSVDNLGYIFLAIGSYLLLDGGLKYIALAGALLHSFNHMVFKDMLFMLSGNIVRATGRSDFEIRGLGENMKATKVLSLVGILSISGIPPTNGFVSKLLIYIATISSGIPLLVIAGAVALLGSALTLAAYVKFYRLFTGVNSKVNEAPLPMLAGEALLGALCILTAIFPNVVLSLTGMGIDVPVSSPVIASGFALLLGVIAFAVLPGKGMSDVPWTTGEDVPPELFEVKSRYMFQPVTAIVELFGMTGERVGKFLRRVKELYDSFEFGYIDEAIFLPPVRFILNFVGLLKELGKSLDSALAVSFLALVTIALVVIVIMGVL